MIRVKYTQVNSRWRIVSACVTGIVARLTVVQFPGCRAGSAITQRLPVTHVEWFP